MASARDFRWKAHRSKRGQSPVASKSKYLLDFSPRRVSRHTRRDVTELLVIHVAPCPPRTNLTEEGRSPI